MNKYKPTRGRKVFLAFDYLFVAGIALICLLPIINLIAVSLSSSSAASAGMVKLWPVDPTLDAYRYVMANDAFWRSAVVTLERIGFALPLTLIVTVLAAYPMSKEKKAMPGRSFYTYLVIIPYVFSVVLIPWYLVVRSLHLTNTIFGLVVPNMAQVFHIILLMNFFRSLPKEIEDASFIDGAGPLAALFRIYIPLSKPCIATITLFIIVNHWNSWFDGIILMDDTRMYPMQSYMQSLLIEADPRKINPQSIEMMKKVSNSTFRAAQIAIATIPVILTYPFLQKYFTSGIVAGSVKG